MCDLTGWLREIKMDMTKFINLAMAHAPGFVLGGLSMLFVVWKGWFVPGITAKKLTEYAEHNARLEVKVDSLTKQLIRVEDDLETWNAYRDKRDKEDLGIT